MDRGIKKSGFFECIPVLFSSLYHLSFYTRSPSGLGLCSLLCSHHNGRWKERGLGAVLQDQCALRAAQGPSAGACSPYLLFSWGPSHPWSKRLVSYVRTIRNALSGMKAADS